MPVVAFSSLYSLFCVSGWLEISRLRYAAESRRALDGVQLLCSLVVDSITSPYIDGRGERIPSKFDQWDYKPPRTRSFKPHLVACKDHNTLLPACSASISPFRLAAAAAALQRSDEPRSKSELTKPGSRPRRGVKRMWSAADKIQMTLWMVTDSSRAGRVGLDGSYL